MADYYTILTHTGKDKVAAAMSGGPALQLAQMAVGDGGGPGFYDQYDRGTLKARNTLVNQQWIEDLNLVDQDPQNPAWVITEGLIPTHVGGWYVREVGIFDLAGDLIAIGVYPETYKPVATAVEADLLVRSIIEVGDAENVELKIDPSQVMATRAWVVDVAIPQALTMLDEKVDEAAVHADRAEAARDVAQHAVGIFHDVEAGIAATSVDAHFWVAIESGKDLVMLYRHDSDGATPMGSYPSRVAFELLQARVDAAARSGSRHARLQREFHGGNPQSPAYSMTDEAGNELITVERSGRVKTNPGPAVREFHTGRRPTGPVVTMTDEHGAVVCELDKLGMPMGRWLIDFHGNGLPDWGYMTPDKRLVHGGFRDGSLFYDPKQPGSSIEFVGLPTTPARVPAGAVWDDYGSVSLPRADNPNLFGSISDIHPTHLDVYDFLDQMQDEFPEYIDSSVIGHDSVGNEIREYTFFNPDYVYHRTEMRAARPTIVLLSNIHGNETAASISNVQFIWNLVYGWRNSEIMGWLRWNSNIVFVPFVCPYGYDNRTRTNPNGVDLNRNFPEGWEETGGNKGPSPASELETQTVMAIPPRYPDAVYIGTHNFSGSSERIFWIGTLTEPGFRVAETVADDVNSFARREYEGMSEYLESGRGAVRLADLINGGMDRYIHQAHGCESYLFESRFGSWGPPIADRQQLGTRALEFLFKRICEQQKNFSIS